MEFFDIVVSKLETFINFPYLVTFMALSYLVKNHFEEFLQKVTKMKWKTVYSVLVIAALIGIPFALIAKEDWAKMLATYSIGTSLHETAFKLIEKKASAALDKLKTNINKEK